MTTPSRRLQIAFELFDEGLVVQRQNLRRRHPDASTEEVDLLLRRWLRSRPGAPHGDADGRAAHLRFR